MFCAVCNRRIADCACKKTAVLNGRWPTGTWLQRRIKKVRIVAMLEDKRKGWQTGASLLETLSFLAVFSIVVGAVWIHAEMLTEIFHAWASMAHCLAALLECTGV